MDETVISVIHFLLTQDSSTDQEERLSKLPKTIASQVKQAASCFKNPFTFMAQELDTLHPSWITPLMRMLSEQDMKIALGALNEEMAQAVKGQLLLRSIATGVSDMGKKYVRKWLWSLITQEVPSLLPMACLPESPLNDLLFIHAGDLEKIIDLLAMHDMNIELKHIIDKAKLKSITGTLSKDQLQYLSHIQSSKEKVIFKRMNLSNWDGNAETLRPLLRQRGLNRFSKAISNEHPSLIWYVKHRLKIDEALLFEKLIDNLQNKEATDALKSDLTELLLSFPKTFFEATA